MSSAPLSGMFYVTGASVPHTLLPLVDVRQRVFYTKKSMTKASIQRPSRGGARSQIDSYEAKPQLANLLWEVHTIYNTFVSNRTQSYPSGKYV